MSAMMSVAGETLRDLLPALSKSTEETREVGRRVASVVESGSIVALYGDLGSGKTLVAKGICEGLGVDGDEVTSPTFSLINEYRGGRLPVYHVDTYRLESLEEFMALGYEDYFFGDGVTIVEWADRVEPLIPPTALRIRLAHVAADQRRIELVLAADDHEGG